MRPAIVIAALTLLILATAYVEAAESEYVLKIPLKPIELTDRTPLTLDVESGEILGGVYRISLTGPGNPLYAKGLFLTPNETGTVELRLEVLQAPSGYKLGVESIWMNPSWCDVHFELAAEGYAGPIRWEGLDFKPEKYVTQEEPLIIKLSIKPYAFKTALPYGEITDCYVHVRVYGNVSFGVNVREKEWSLGYPVYVMRPEETLGVEVKSPLLRFKVEPDGFIRKVFLDAELDVTNNLKGDMVLKKIWATVALGPGIAKAPGWKYEEELNHILKRGQSERIRLEKEWGGYKWLNSRNGTVMIGLYYLTENGSGIKRFFYAFDLSEAERISPQATTTKSATTTTLKSQSHIETQTTVSTAPTSRSRLGGLPTLIGDLGRMLLNPVTILLVLGLVFSIACLAASRGGKERRGAGETEAGPRPPPLPPPALPPPPERPPPSPRRGAPIIPRPQAREAIPRWVYGECLKIMEGKYREFRRLREAGEPRYALYALHDGLEAALKLYAKAARLITLEDEKRMTLGDVLKLLSQRHLISQIEDRLIRQVIEVRNRYKHLDITTEPDKKIVDNCGVAYEVVMREFKKRYSRLPPEEQV